jgi:hypothetical protein
MASGEQAAYHRDLFGASEIVHTFFGGGVRQVIGVGDVFQDRLTQVRPGLAESKTG